MRFRCILGERKLRYHQTKAGKIVYACATLHNYLIFNRFNILHDMDEIDNHIENIENIEININNNNRIDRNAGIARRNDVIAFIRQHNL